MNHLHHDLNLPGQAFSSSLELDFVEYHIFLNDSTLESSQRDAKGPSKSLLLIRKEELMNSITNFTDDYIWQREKFYLEIWEKEKTTKSHKKGQQESIESDGPRHLFGRVHFGENIEDEWFIVWLLMKMSAQFEDLVISVTDNDGQFLLIECALVIPKWLRPENSQNRIFLHKGNLHIVPVPTSPAELALIPTPLSLTRAISLVVGTAIQTEGDAIIQETVKKRIGNYPQKIQENLHIVRCFLPPLVASLLASDPQLIAGAVNAFCYRDQQTMKHCTRMAKFLPQSSETPSTVSSHSIMNITAPTYIRLTRCLYAQLMSQDFHPPRCFGTLPPSTHPDTKALSLGVKIACGMEILYHSQKGKDVKESDSTNPNTISVSDHIDTLLTCPTKTTKPVPLKEDDDSWLFLDADHLDSLLQEKHADLGKESKKEETWEPQQLEKIIDKMKDFMSGTSDYEGIDSKKTHKKKKEDGGEVGLDPDRFFTIMDSILGNPSKNIPSWREFNEEGKEEDESEEDNEDEDEDEEDDSEEEEDIDESTLKQIMQQMDNELRGFSSLSEFETVPDDLLQEQEEDKPIDLNLNLVKNLLESYGAQQGLAGPVTNILGQLKEKEEKQRKSH